MGCLNKVLNNPITTFVEDAALIATGNPEFIPLANAATRTAGGVARGESFGKALGQGAISGGEAFAGQEVAGALGFGSGNTAVNDALGINISPAATGLPDVAGFLSHGLDSAGAALGFTSSGTAAPVAGTGAGGVMLDASGQSLTSAPASTTTVTSPGGGFQSAAQAIGSQDSSIDTLLGNGIEGTSTPTATTLGSVASSPTLAAGAASAPAGAAAASAPTSGGFMSSLEGAAGRAALPLGALAYSALQGPSSLPSQAQPLTANGAVTQPLIDTETAGLNNYNKGTLSQPQQAQVLQFVQGSQNQLIQQLVNSGVTNFKNDSRYVQGMQDIQNQSIAMQNQMLQQTFDNAFHAAGAAGTNLGAVANQQVQQDKDFQDAMAAAFAGVGMAAGGGAFSKAA